MKAVKLLADVHGYFRTYFAGEIVELNPPDIRIDEYSGKLVIRQSMCVYLHVSKHNFEIIEI